MNEVQKKRLEELRARKPEELEQAEKTELDLLITIEKMATQITEANSMLGKRATELDNLNKELEKLKDGPEKKALEDRIKEKEEALELARVGLKSLTEAQEQSKKIAEQFPAKSSGHGDHVDPAAVDALEKKAKESPEAKAAVEKAFSAMTAEEKTQFKTDIAFRKKFFEMALPAGDESDDSPWSKEKDGEGVIPSKTQEDRLKELFNTGNRNGSRLPPSSSWRAGRTPSHSDPNRPVRRERPVDNRTE